MLHIINGTHENENHNTTAFYIHQKLESLTILSAEENRI